MEERKYLLPYQEVYFFTVLGWISTIQISWWFLSSCIEELVKQQNWMEQMRTKVERRAKVLG